jgi:hypothetical protein
MERSWWTAACTPSLQAVVLEPGTALDGLLLPKVLFGEELLEESERDGAVAGLAALAGHADGQAGGKVCGADGRGGRVDVLASRTTRPVGADVDGAGVEGGGVGRKGGKGLDAHVPALSTTGGPGAHEGVGAEQGGETRCAVFVVEHQFYRPGRPRFSHHHLAFDEIPKLGQGSGECRPQLGDRTSHVDRTGAGGEQESGHRFTVTTGCNAHTAVAAPDASVAASTGSTAL